MSAPEFSLTVQCSAGSTIDAAKGLLRGVTVAEIGTATGHFAFLDEANKVVCVGGANDAPQGSITKRVPLCMDAKSIETVVNAGKMANRVKAREDHDDTVGARAGFAENFRKEDGKAVCDMNVFESYRNRGVFLETATSTPELIGLSGDFKFTAEIIGGCAMMRVSKVDAVDIVDKGALTHAGLFKAKGEAVDAQNNLNAEPLHIMAKTIEAPDLKAFKTMCDAVAAYKAQAADGVAGIDECMASLLPKPAAPAAPLAAASAAKPESETMTSAELSALKTDLTKELSASFATLAEQSATKAVAAAQVEFQKQLSALGIKPGAAPAVVAPGAEVKVPAADAPKDFLVLKASIAAERKITPAAATRAIIAEQPAVYEAYQAKMGMTKAKAA